MKRLLIAWLGTTLLWGVQARAADVQPDTVVRWTTHGVSLGECVSWETLQKDVETRLARRVFSSHEEGAAFDLELRSTVTVETDLYRIQLALVMSDGTEMGERELSAHSCDELKVLLPAVVAVLLRPDEPGSATEPPPLPAVVVVDEVATPPEEPPTRAEPSNRQSPSESPSLPPPWFAKSPPWCAASAGLLFGFGPEVTMRTLMGCGVSPLPLVTLALDAEVRFPSGQDDPHLQLRGFGGRFAACFTPRASLSAGGCLALSVIRTTASALVEEQTRQQDSRTAVEGSAFARIRYVKSRFLAQLDAGVALPTERPRYTLVEANGAEVLLYQPGRVFPSVDLGVGMVFE